jgi:hypothetical protein
MPQSIDSLITDALFVLADGTRPMTGGLEIDETDDYALDASSVITNASQGAALLAHSHNTTTDGAYYTYGMSVFSTDNVSSGKTNSGNLGAARFYARIAAGSSGTCTYITAFTIVAGIDEATASTNVTQCQGLDVTVPNGGSGTITTGIGLRLQSPAGAGTITTRIGVYSTGEDYNQFDGGVRAGSYSDATRPTASGLPAGTMIWNTSDGAPNFATAGGWVDAMGTAT